MERNDHARGRIAKTDPTPAPQDIMFGPNGLAQRIQAAAFGAIGCLPRAPRAWAAMICHAVNLQRLTTAMTRWVHGAPVNEAPVGRLFLGRDAEDALIRLLRDAAPRVYRAADHAELGDAAIKIAAAILIVGPERWSRFLVELEDGAPDTTAAQPGSGNAHQPAPPGPETPRPADVPGSEPKEPGSAGQADSRPVAGQTQPSPPAPAHAAHTPPRPAAGPGRPLSSRRTASTRILPSAGMTSPVGFLPIGLIPTGVVPPVRNPVRLQPGDASRPAWSGAAERSLWDDQGGEWQYHAGDAWRHPHWDYNAHSDPNTPWRSIPMQGRSLWRA